LTAPDTFERVTLVFTCSKCGNGFSEDQKVPRYLRCWGCHRAYKKQRAVATRDHLREYARAWKREHAMELNAQRRAQRTKDVDPDWRKEENAKQQVRRASDPKRTAEYNRKNRERHFDKHKARNREWKRANYQRVLAWNAARRSRQNEGIAKFFRDELVTIYEGCPYGWHVDHVHPLNGANFSGLHVPWNLQYLPAAENIRKRNRLDLTGG
jgi:DNA-directed RNA polymerase subunit RPC12/RpoP